jgi:hypothetical protein
MLPGRPDCRIVRRSVLVAEPAAVFLRKDLSRAYGRYAASYLCEPGGRRPALRRFRRDRPVKLEIYVPAAKREFGYFVLPILHRDRLVGRVDPLFDRKAGLLRVRQVYAEEGATENAGAAIAKAIHELARWLGASDVDYGRVPRVWQRAFG